MALDSPQGSTGLGGDLVEAQLAEEAQRDDLAIGLVETADRRAESCGALGSKGTHCRIRTSRKVDAGRRIARIDPCHVASALGSAERDPDGDARQPGPERSVATPAGEAPEGGHEGLLGGVLGIVEVAEDSVAGADDRGRLAIDEDPERVAIAGKHGLDSGALIDDLGLGGC